VPPTPRIGAPRRAKTRPFESLEPLAKVSILFAQGSNLIS
jgi:hypothetical protein